MRKYLLSLLGYSLLTTAAMAQVNVVPQVGVSTATLRASTYGAVSVGLAVAASTTDFLCINGSTSKNIHVRRFIINGTATTAVNEPIIIKLNHSLDTGGTAATGKALPVAAPFSTGNAAATATLTSYTANPTVNDSTPNLLTAFGVTFGATTGLELATQVQAGTSVDNYDQGWDIPKAGTVVQQVCLNLNGTSSSATVNVSVEWTEE